MLNLLYLKSRNQISLPLDISYVDVSSVILNAQGDYIITVESTKTGTTCQHCGRKITKFYGYGRWIELRHLSILGHRVYLRLRPKRYECPHCNGRTTTQTLDWYTPRSPHTKAYDNHLLLQLVNSTVAGGIPANCG
ncbi:MAG: transposase family protein [Chloroflexi bacterium]|nr:transposase family protein [Chloroflexota bacterium]